MEQLSIDWKHCWQLKVGNRERLEHNVDEMNLRAWKCLVRCKEFIPNFFHAFPLGPIVWLHDHTSQFMAASGICRPFEVGAAWSSCPAWFYLTGSCHGTAISTWMLEVPSTQGQGLLLANQHLQTVNLSKHKKKWINPGLKQSFRFFELPHQYVVLRQWIFVSIPGSNYLVYGLESRNRNWIQL